MLLQKLSRAQQLSGHAKPVQAQDATNSSCQGSASAMSAGYQAI
jgi:hypothetical protein